MNGRFRNYVTDVAFRLTLGKTHITALMTKTHSPNRVRLALVGLRA